MLHKKIVRLFLVVSLMGLLTGCAATAPSPQEMLEEIAPAFESFTFRLPRLYLQYVDNEQGEGEPMIAGISASTIESWFGLDLSMVKIPKFYVDWLKASDLQHIELVYDGNEGIFAYANGKPMPYLAWDGQSLALAADMVEAFNVPNASLIKRVLPFVQRIGLDVVVQMPLAGGCAVIPYRDEYAGLLETTAAPEIAEPSARLQVEIVYDQDGVPSVLGLSADLLAEMGYGIPGQLPAETIAMLQAANIQYVTLQTQGNGLFLYANDQLLPNVAWSEDHLTNAVDLYAQMNASSWVANEAFVNMVQELVFAVGNSDILLVVRLP